MNLQKKGCTIQKLLKNLEKWLISKINEIHKEDIKFLEGVHEMFNE